MAKLFLTVLIIILVGFGVYYFFLGKPSSVAPLTNSNQQETVADAEVLSTTAEDDLTALEKDLVELEKTQMDFNSELNNL